jgi:hypothetical protein
VIQLALTYHLPLVAGNLSRADASRVVRDGVASSFDPQGVKDYKLDQPLPAALAPPSSRKSSPAIAICCRR